MSDIVERLLAWEPMVSSGYECPAAGTAMHEAATEIERLRAEPQVKHYSDCAVHNEPAFPAGPCNCGGYTDSALAEIERLRRALEQAQLYVERDEVAHGRQFGTGNAIRAALSQEKQGWNG